MRQYGGLANLNAYLGNFPRRQFYNILPTYLDLELLCLVVKWSWKVSPAVATGNAIVMKPSAPDTSVGYSHVHNRESRQDI